MQDALSNIMRLNCSRSKKKDANGILRDGTPLRYMVGVDILRNCPKFSRVTAKKVELESIKSLTASDEQQTATNFHKDSKGLLIASPSKHIAKVAVFTRKSCRRANSYDVIESLATVVRPKTAVKERELRLRCISELPDIEMETKLLLKFLESSAKKEQGRSEVKAESVESTYSDGNQTRMSIVYLISFNEIVYCS